MIVVVSAVSQFRDLRDQAALDQEAAAIGQGNYPVGNGAGGLFNSDHRTRTGGESKVIIHHNSAVVEPRIEELDGTQRRLIKIDVNMHEGKTAFRYLAKSVRNPSLHEHRIFASLKILLHNCFAGREISFA